MKPLRRWPVFKFGTSNILAQSGVVSDAFGRNRGFVIMLLALFAAPVNLAVIALIYTALFPKFEPANASPRGATPVQFRSQEAAPAGLKSNPTTSSKKEHQP